MADEKDENGKPTGSPLPPKRKKRKPWVIVVDVISGIVVFCSCAVIVNVTYLNVNFNEHRCLEFYADKLCITTKYLSNITRMVTHKSASKLISLAIIGEAKKLLVESRMTVSQIADKLGFPNVSSFGKYFKKEVGVTPTKFRHTL